MTISSTMSQSISRNRVTRSLSSLIEYDMPVECNKSNLEFTVHAKNYHLSLFPSNENHHPLHGVLYVYECLLNSITTHIYKFYRFISLNVKLQIESLNQLLLNVFLTTNQNSIHTPHTIRQDRVGEGKEVVLLFSLILVIKNQN